MGKFKIKWRSNEEVIKYKYEWLMHWVVIDPNGLRTFHFTWNNALSYVLQNIKEFTLFYEG